jgi:hypothetical protein
MTSPVKAFSFPEETVFDLTHGDCWFLAASLSKATNLPYATIYGDGEIQHVGIELPDGRIVDIEGIWEPHDWETRWYDELEAFEVYLGCSPSEEEGDPILHDYWVHIEDYYYGDLRLADIRDDILKTLVSV